LNDNLKPVDIYLLNSKILSASEDRSIRLWDSQTGSLLAQLEGHTAAVTSIKTSPDGKLIASSSEDHTIRLWDYEEEKFIRSLEGHQERVTSVAFNGDGSKLLSVSLDKTMRVWDVKTGDGIDTITGHSGHPLCCAWSPVDDGVAATCGDQLEMFIWDLNARRVRFVPQFVMKLFGDVKMLTNLCTITNP
jgi:WD40 repeat protein